MGIWRGYHLNFWYKIFSFFDLRLFLWQKRGPTVSDCGARRRSRSGRSAQVDVQADSDSPNRGTGHGEHRQSFEPKQDLFDHLGLLYIFTILIVNFQ